MTKERITQQSELIYGLEDRPPLSVAIFAALQHFLAIIVGLMVPPLVFGNAVKLETSTITYLISMSLFVSGVATFIQVRKIGPVGSGLLSIQGTSFAFLSVIIAIGFDLKRRGYSDDEMLSTLFGTLFVASFIEIILSRFIHHLKRIITPLISGIVVTLIGLSLIKVAITDFGGGAWLLKNKPELFGNYHNIILGFLVLFLILFLNRSKNIYLKMSAIVIALVVGYVVAIFMGKVNFSGLSKASFVAIPHPFKYGMWGFDIAGFIPLAFLFLITVIESVGDLTATSMVSKQPIEGEQYVKTIQGGVLGDGVNSAIAAFFNSLPNTTFSQNNGVIHLTGIASRYIGIIISIILIFAGIFPVIGNFFNLIPNSVLGGATILMFGTVAVSGLRIIFSHGKIDARGVIIIAVSMGLGLGVAFVPQVLNSFPPVLKSVFSSSITTGGITAIFCNIILPRSSDVLGGSEDLNTEDQDLVAAVWDYFNQ